MCQLFLSKLASRDLVAAQNDLKGTDCSVNRVVPYFVTEVSSHPALHDKVRSVRSDIEKLNSGNATLQMYIDNLTMQMAKRR
jgi:hypothetical protein